MSDNNNEEPVFEGDDDDQTIMRMQMRIKEIENESLKLQEAQRSAQNQDNSGSVDQSNHYNESHNDNDNNNNDGNNNNNNEGGDANNDNNEGGSDGNIIGSNYELPTTEFEANQEAQEDVDGRSVHVGNVDFSATPEELYQHFAACGTVNRVTILAAKTGRPLGYAYIEFASPDTVENALALNESLFKARLISVRRKRKNLPRFMMARGRGRGGRGRAAFRAGYRGISRGRGKFF